jgi:hypothetical protein
LREFSLVVEVPPRYCRYLPFALVVLAQIDVMAELE